jgi:hypothetical protein
VAEGDDFAAERTRLAPNAQTPPSSGGTDTAQTHKLTCYSKQTRPATAASCTNPATLCTLLLSSPWLGAMSLPP